MRQRIRTPLRILVLVTVMLCLSATSAFAAVGDYNGSTIKGTITCGSGTFVENCSGYRMYICNPDGSLASINKAENI